MSDADDKTTASTSDPKARERRSPAFLATAVALPVAVVACFVVFLVVAQQKQGDARDAAEAGHLKAVPAAAAGEPACATLLGALPADLDGYTRTGDTAPTGFARWTKEKAGAVEVRCGTDRPAELTATAKLQIINGVQWLQATPSGAPAPHGGSYWTAVDHRPYVTLWVPDGAGTSAVQATSDAIREHLQAGSLDLGK